MKFLDVSCHGSGTRARREGQLLERRGKPVDCVTVGVGVAGGVGGLQVLVLDGAPDPGSILSLKKGGTWPGSS